MSARHHYLPRFYIKGFTNEDGVLFVLDRNKGEVLEKPKSPKQFFFEWNRNTLNIPGTVDYDKDFIEKGYASIESKLAEDIKELLQDTTTVTYDSNSLFSTMLLASLIFWRLPVNDEKAVDLLTSNSDELFFNLIDKKTGQTADRHLREKWISDPNFHKFFKLTRAVTEFTKVKLGNNWRFVSNGPDNVGRILSDSPIIITGGEEHNFLNSTYVYPVNKQVEFISKFNNPKITQFEPDFTVCLDILRVAQSNRYAGSNNQAYLNDIWKLAKEVNTQPRIDYYRNRIGNMINSAR